MSLKCLCFRTCCFLLSGRCFFTFSHPSFLADGADHLKEILSSFFVHHKMNTRRLRQIVQRLQPRDRKSRDRASRLTFSALHELIDAWISSATAGQIRQLPAMLRKAGAKGAAERLENKLQRIDSRLIELCSLGNDVEVVLTSGWSRKRGVWMDQCSL